MIYGFMFDRWNRTAYNIRKKHECESSLSGLIDVVDQETTLINDPMFSKETLECYSRKTEKKSDRKYRKNLFSGNRTSHFVLQGTILKNVMILKG